MINDEFTKRGEAFEAGAAHAEDIAFRVKARRLHLFAEWVARQMSASDEETKSYVKRMVDLAANPSCFITPAQIALVDLRKEGFSHTPAAVKDIFDSLEEQARIDVGAVPADLGAAGNRATTLDGRSNSPKPPVLES